MGFNRRKMEDERRRAAEKKAANRRATDAQVLEDAEQLIAAWNERQASRRHRHKSKAAQGRQGPRGDRLATAGRCIRHHWGRRLKFLLYTGLRLSEPLSLSREDIRLDDCAAWARRKKGQAHSEITLQL
jgi:integrase